MEQVSSSEKKKVQPLRGWAVASLTCGVLGIVALGIIPCVAQSIITLGTHTFSDFVRLIPFAIIIPICAVVFCFVQRKHGKSAMATAGLVLGVIAISLSVSPMGYVFIKPSSDAAILSEGVASVGVIRSQLRVYHEDHGTYSGATYSASSNNIGLPRNALLGKYYAASDYALSGVTDTRYTVTAGPPSRNCRPGPPKYQVDQNGSETDGKGFCGTTSSGMWIH